jgi:hypothetical protein
MTTIGRQLGSRSWLALAAAAGIAGAPFAASAAPPAKASCDGGDAFDRVTCRQAAVAAQLGYTADTVFAEGTKLNRNTTRDRVTHVRNGKAIAQRATRNHGRDAFKRHAKNEALVNKGGGHLVPLRVPADDANGDGICDFEQGTTSAKCAAIELDANGNLQECNPGKKMKGKGQRGSDGLECDVFLETDPASQDSRDMEEAAAELDATYGSTEDALIEMNQHLDMVNASGTVAAAVAGSDDCTPPAVDGGLGLAVKGLRIVYATVFGIARQTADMGGQDALGFNSRGITLLPETAAIVANIAYITTEEIYKSETAAVQSKIMSCVQKVAGDVAILAAEVSAMHAEMRTQHMLIMTNDNNNTAVIMGQIEDVRREVVDLLNTPQGQRPLFPIK